MVLERSISGARNIWRRVKQRLPSRRSGASVGPSVGETVGQSTRAVTSVVMRVFAAFTGKQPKSALEPGTVCAGVDPDIAAAATVSLYREVISRLEEHCGPRGEALVAPLFALAEFEAARGEADKARRAAAAAQAIILTRWGRRHPLWPLVKARHDAISHMTAYPKSIQSAAR